MAYEVRCKKCDRKYIGETARNAFTRGREHWKGIAKKSKDSTVCSMYMVWRAGGGKLGSAGSGASTQLRT